MRGMRARRTLVWVLGTCGALLGLVVAGGGWVYAGQLLPAPARDRTLDVTATVTPRGTVLLPRERRACLERFGLLLPDDVFLVYSGPVVAGTCSDDPAATGTVERTIEEVVRGEPQPDLTVPARFDEYVFEAADPSVLDLDFTDVDIPLADDLGVAPAWLIEGERPDTVFMVHGRSGTRAEALRLLPTIADAGYRVIVITYRNDMAGGPDTDDLVGRFGQTEWQDLRSAFSLAREQGAQRIALVGYSQGGSVISYFLRNADEEELAVLAGVVLDSPLLSLGSTLVQQARLRDIPGPLIPPILFGTRQVARLRSGFGIGDVEHIDTLAELEVPLLLLHGDADDFVPVDPSDELVARRQQAGLDTTFERIEGAGHVEGWNTDEARYTGAVADFLARVMP
ncbi:alpha/beta hydrolase [soil metagenome]